MIRVTFAILAAIALAVSWYVLCIQRNSADAACGLLLASMCMQIYIYETQKRESKP